MADESEAVKIFQRAGDPQETLDAARRDRMLIPLGASGPEIWTGLGRVGPPLPENVRHE